MLYLVFTSANVNRTFYQIFNEGGSYPQRCQSGGHAGPVPDLPARGAQLPELPKDRENVHQPQMRATIPHLQRSRLLQVPRRGWGNSLVLLVGPVKGCNCSAEEKN